MAGGAQPGPGRPRGPAAGLPLAGCKLLELDEGAGFIKEARVAVELGAAPGGWTQALRRANPALRVVAVDLLPMEPVEGAAFVQGDFTDPAVQERLRELAGGRADLLLSDAAPDLSGVADRDAARCEDLHRAVLECCAALGPRALLAKTFGGEPLEFLRAEARRHFAKVQVKRPRTTRSRSQECYVLARESIE
ncbi:MAG: RlmE family RNA methyltransferase [Betaproteobacteria bacterium AqS2]|uniref:Ribosomal RNA large subunit methyltransferase E n=1 Tax=Candidatus Amphirhobacter heronislandensis TaxID=1732024 RepID=A0A930UF81_9GAMM|nr:RlmE family RNA methyltransferase [Betaproteobacteria bacterium AqS2]